MVRDLLVRNIIGVDNWERQKKQDIVINLRIFSSVASAANSDFINDTVNYSTITKEVTEFTENTQFKSVEGLAEGIATVCVEKCKVKSLILRVEKPRALLMAASAGVEISRYAVPYTKTVDDKEVTKYKSSGRNSEDSLLIKDLLCRAIIGLNPWERDEKQDVLLNLTLFPIQSPASQRDYVPQTHNYRTICRTIVNHVEQSSFLLIEALSSSIAEVLIKKCHVRKVSLSVEKPSALLFAKSAGVHITRSQIDYAASMVDPKEDNFGRRRSIDAALATGAHTAFIALGCNLGDRSKNIAEAIVELERSCDCKVLNTSFLYETPPWGLEDQPAFLNAACKVITHKSPLELLKALKEVEAGMGREKTVQWGPRTIDLDILLYDNIEMETEELTIPHAWMHKREFVLRPMNDIAPDIEHPKLAKTISQLLRHLQEKVEGIHKVTPFNNHLLQWGTKTFVMGVLNVTPDSFSDGGLYMTVDAAMTHVKEMIAQKADIIDVGGMSTKPNAVEISEEEELSRVIPIIKEIRKEYPELLISIDTFRANVAKKAVEAGANMINDVTGGQRDPNMYATMAALGVPVCLMHTRGDSKTMILPESKIYPENDVVRGVRNELSLAVTKAIRSGVLRWNIIIDPGIGFAKKAEQSYQLIRQLPNLLNSETGELYGFPVLVGPSRKGFIGMVLKERKPEERTWGTAATCAALVAGKVDVLRVHDVGAMKDVIRVADHIWRLPSSAIKQDKDAGNESSSSDF